MVSLIRAGTTPERRNNVRYIDGQPFRDTPEPREVEPPKRVVPEWVRRARASELPVKVYR